MVEISLHTRQEILDRGKKIKVTISIGKETLNIIQEIQEKEYRTVSNAIESYIIRCHNMMKYVDTHPEIKKLLQDEINNIESKIP